MGKLTPEGRAQAAAPEAGLQVAAEHATARVPLAKPGDCAGGVRSALLGRAFESAGDVVVLDGDRVVGVVSIERLLAADAGVPVGTIMDAEPPAVLPDVDQEAAAWLMIEHAESSLVVVDRDRRFLGVIPPQRMLAVLLAEHDEDLARLGGYMASTSTARRAAEEPVDRRLWHRLPWLVVGLIGAMLSAILVGTFEQELSEEVLLAVFVPGVVYMADAVGTQTETLLIRGLSVGIGIRTVVRRELLTGAVIGLLIAAVFFPFALLAWGDTSVAVAVALALFASCSIATIVGMALPVAFHRFGRDPAFGSGPLATVIQDLLSIAIYFAIAIPLTT